MIKGCCRLYFNKASCNSNPFLVLKNIRLFLKKYWTRNQLKLLASSVPCNLYLLRFVVHRISVFRRKAITQRIYKVENSSEFIRRINWLIDLSPNILFYLHRDWQLSGVCKSVLTIPKGDWKHVREKNRSFHTTTRHCDPVLGSVPLLLFGSKNPRPKYCPSVQLFKMCTLYTNLIYNSALCF